MRLSNAVIADRKSFVRDLLVADNKLTLAAINGKLTEKFGKAMGPNTLIRLRKEILTDLNNNNTPSTNNTEDTTVSVSPTPINDNEPIETAASATESAVSDLLRNFPAEIFQNEVATVTPPAEVTVFEPKATETPVVESSEDEPSTPTYTFEDAKAAKQALLAGYRGEAWFDGLGIAGDNYKVYTLTVYVKDMAAAVAANIPTNFRGFAVKTELASAED